MREAIEQLDESAPAVQRAPARHSIRRKALIAVATAVLLSTGVCGFVTHRLAQSSLHQVQATNLGVLSDMAERLATTSWANEGREGIGQALEVMSFDPRICFAVARDGDGVLIARRIMDTGVWQHYNQYFLPTMHNGMIDVNRSIPIERQDGSTYQVRKQAMVRPTSEGTSSEQLMGYVELGIINPHAAQIQTHLQLATLAVVAGICLVTLPIAMWGVSHFVKPLRRMAAATIHLAAGWQPEPIPVTSRDEIGLLAESFNAMSESLWATQQELFEANQVLETKVAERTADLNEANEQLQREMQEKDSYIRVVTHDLNAPLRNIAGITQLLLRKHAAQLETDVVGKLERISANVKAETELIDDLLELSRIRSRPVKRQEVDLNELVGMVIESFSFDLQEQRIDLRVDEGLPTVHADRTRVRQVFMNLIDNAIKYMPADAAVREIHVGDERVDGEWRLYVKDTGGGIAAEDHQEIFQVFRRGTHSGADDVPGRGVGLAGVKVIIESHGGRLTVDSELGGGATFRFTLGQRMVTSDNAVDAAAAAV